MPTTAQKTIGVHLDLEADDYTNPLLTMILNKFATEQYGKDTLVKQDVSQKFIKNIKKFLKDASIATESVTEEVLNDIKAQLSSVASPQSTENLPLEWPLHLLLSLYFIMWENESKHQEHSIVTKYNDILNLCAKKAWPKIFFILTLNDGKHIKCSVESLLKHAEPKKTLHEVLQAIEQKINNELSEKIAIQSIAIAKANDPNLVDIPLVKNYIKSLKAQSPAVNPKSKDAPSPASSSKLTSSSVTSIPEPPTWAEKYLYTVELNSDSTDSVNKAAQTAFGLDVVYSDIDGDLLVIAILNAIALQQPAAFNALFDKFNLKYDASITEVIESLLSSIFNPDKKEDFSIDSISDNQVKLTLAELFNITVYEPKVIDAATLSKEDAATLSKEDFAALGTGNNPIAIIGFRSAESDGLFWGAFYGDNYDELRTAINDTNSLYTIVHSELKKTVESVVKDYANTMGNPLANITSTPLVASQTPLPTMGPKVDPKLQAVVTTAYGNLTVFPNQTGENDIYAAILNGLKIQLPDSFNLFLKTYGINEASPVSNDFLKALVQAFAKNALRIEHLTHDAFMAILAEIFEVQIRLSTDDEAQEDSVVLKEGFEVASNSSNSKEAVYLLQYWVDIDTVDYYALKHKSNAETDYKKIDQAFNQQTQTSIPALEYDNTRSPKEYIQAYIAANPDSEEAKAILAVAPTLGNTPSSASTASTAPAKPKVGGNGNANGKDTKPSVSTATATNGSATAPASKSSSALKAPVKVEQLEQAVSELRNAVNTFYGIMSLNAVTLHGILFGLEYQVNTFKAAVDTFNAVGDAAINQFLDQHYKIPFQQFRNALQSVMQAIPAQGITAATFYRYEQAFKDCFTALKAMRDPLNKAYHTYNGVKANAQAAHVASMGNSL